MVKMCTALAASVTGQSVSSSHGSQSNPGTHTCTGHTSRVTSFPGPLRRTLLKSGQAQRAGGQCYSHRLLLGSHLLATLDLQRHFDTRQWAEFGCGLGDVALVPLCLPVLEGDRAIGMIDARDDMLQLFPDRAPHDHIIKATIQQPGHRLVLFKRRERLAHATSSGA